MELQDFRLFDLLHHLKEMPLKEDALAAKENGVWRKYSTQEYIDTVNYLSYAFIDLGIKPGDKVIVSGTQFLLDGAPVIPQS